MPGNYLDIGSDQRLTAIRGRTQVTAIFNLPVRLYVINALRRSEVEHIPASS